MNFRSFSFLIHERSAVAEVVIYTGLQEKHNQIVSSFPQPQRHLLRLDQHTNGGINASPFPLPTSPRKGADNYRSPPDGGLSGPLMWQIRK